MKDSEVRKLIKKKLFLIDCFLFTGALSPGKESALTMKHGVTNYYLRSMILELIIKALYELDNRVQAPYTHNVLKLFGDLDKTTITNVRNSYDSARKRQQDMYKNIDKQVKFPPIHKVLEANEKFVKNFKYDAMASKSNYSADGQFHREMLSLINDKLLLIGDT